MHQLPLSLLPVMPAGGQLVSMHKSAANEERADRAGGQARSEFSGRELWKGLNDKEELASMLQSVGPSRQRERGCLL